jgi:hypothetical protein
VQLHYKMVPINFEIKKQKCEFYRLLFYASINSKFSRFHKQIVCIHVHSGALGVGGKPIGGFQRIPTTCGVI